MSNGVPADKIKLPTSLPTLRNASIAWLLDAYKFFTDNRDIVKDAWARSKVTGLNLTWSSLMSEGALKNLDTLRMSDPEFNQEFAKFDPEKLLTVSGDLEADKEIISGADCDFLDDDASLSTIELVNQCSDPSSVKNPGLASHEDLVQASDAEIEWPGFYPSNIAMQGGTNLAYYQTAEDACITDKATRKKTKKAKKVENKEVREEVVTEKVGGGRECRG